ncbi:MAG: tRNA (N6-threonylcarbamoyladenosine(37)-N6)-methyltransferase TrmO [Bacteroidales bacterium]|nr:tRNA (N6-threonylcarbamoyladenosine(37)-N6)-methyltransferase TrmO [Bacteroidales bacterium]
MEIIYQTIGYLVTAFDNPEEMPIQPCSRLVKPGHAVIEPEYFEGLKDIETFSHVILIYHFHRRTKTSLRVKPFLDQEERGVFATRAPVRPNAIGLSIVKLVKIEENRLYFENLDMLNGTPLLDIKPYVPEFDQPSEATSGWLSALKDTTMIVSDKRFE